MTLHDNMDSALQPVSRPASDENLCWNFYDPVPVSFFLVTSRSHEL